MLVPCMFMYTQFLSILAEFGENICDIWCIYVSRPYGSVSAAFWATLRGDTLYVVMTAHKY